LSPANVTFSEVERQRRLARYVSFYQHRALRDAAFQMHPELLKGFNSGDKHQLQVGLRHAWFKVPLMLGVEASMTQAREYIAAIGHERRDIGPFTVHFLSMPRPERSPEASFIAIAWRAGERPSYPDRSQTTRYFTLEMMSDQGFAFCEWNLDTHLNYGDAGSSLAAFVGLVTERLGGAGSQPVATFDWESGARLVGAPKGDAAANSQTLIAAIEEYQRLANARRRAIMEWLAPRLKEMPEVAKILDSIVFKYVQNRFGAAGDQALARIAEHIKQFPSDPLLREVLAQQVFSRFQVGLPVEDLKRDIEHQIPEWKPLMGEQAASEVLEKYLELLSLMQEKRIKLGLAKLMLPIGGNA
jgi:hypothetical protein